MSEWGNPPNESWERKREPGEVNHLSNPRKRNRRDSPSSGERKGRSPNHIREIAHRRCVYEVKGPSEVLLWKYRGEIMFSRMNWEVQPKKVKVL